MTTRLQKVKFEISSGNSYKITPELCKTLKHGNKIGGSETKSEKRPLVNIHDIILALEGGIIV